MSVNIPDFMPVLRHGVGETPQEGGCLMQCASFIANGTWEDRPECVHDFLNDLGIKVNDAVSDGARSALSLVIPDLLNSDDAYNAWESGKTETEVRDFWSEQAGHVASLFRRHGVQTCSSCLAAIRTADEPEAAARNYARCAIENAATILWNDDTCYDVAVRQELGLPNVSVEKERELVSIYDHIVSHFNASISNSAVQISNTQWRELREAMTPEAAPA